MARQAWFAVLRQKRKNEQEGFRINNGGNGVDGKYTTNNTVSGNYTPRTALFQRSPAREKILLATQIY